MARRFRVDVGSTFRPIAFVTAFALGAAVAIPEPAEAGHGQVSPCRAPDQQTVAVEQGQFGRDGSKADIQRIDPVPNPETAIIRSIYLWSQDGLNMVEFGWGWGKTAADLPPPDVSTVNKPIAFAARLLNGVYYATEGSSSNPGTGVVPVGTETYKITRSGSVFLFYRNGNYFGSLGNSNLQGGGQPTAGVEGKGPCEDLQAAFLDLDRRDTPNGPWQDWTNVFRPSSLDLHTNWWYTEKNDAPPKYWVKHCDNINCPNA